MNAAATIGAAMVASALTAVLVSVAMAPSDGERPIGSGPAVLPIDQLRNEQQQLRAEFEQLQRRLAQAPVPERTVPTDSGIDEQRLAEMVAAAVERAMADSKNEPSQPFDLKRLVPLTSDRLTAEQKQAIWMSLRESDDLGEAVRYFESLAAASPNDSMAQTQLAKAYFQQMLAAKTGPERGQWGSKAAAKLEQALQLDPRNWDARFALAQHYFWAEMRGDAKKHFEVLVQQQPQRIAEPRHAGAYLWLGNILLDQGDKDGARRVWHEGLTLFPGDAQLQQRIDALQ